VETVMEREARYWEARPDGRVQCLLCPHTCTVAPGKRGRCGVRANREGRLYTLNYGEVSSLADDPIEKKPLYHFYPGRSILSVGTVGCSFRCRFCQNHGISQNPDHPTEYISPDKLVGLALQEGSLGIAYTYNEPFVWYEYVLDCCGLARERGLKNVFVTNGHLNPEPLAELLPLADAFNVDLKSFRPGFYRSLVGGELEPVKRTIREIASRPGITLEVTTLVIPGHNDSEDEMDELAGWLASLRPDIPYHLSAYFPRYRLHAPPTPAAILERLRETAGRHLQYVYVGNVPGPSETLCPECGALLISRRGYHVTRGRLAYGKCESCGTPVPIVM
jgi:pyruvate formate lyase activating enzyme